MAGLREGKSSTEDVSLTPTCGAHEDVLMRRFQLPPREGQPCEDAGTEGAMAGRHASFILGRTGVGKTKRMPRAEVLVLAGVDTNEVLHVLPQSG